MSIDARHGDAIEQMRLLPDASIDAVITDPPYELGFMGKHWDGTGIAYSVELWAEALRVLKPGGYLAAFGGTRTYHRMTCAIEDAGFEIRDSLHWIMGSGFPKSLNVSKDPRFCQCGTPVPCNHAGDVHGVRQDVQQTAEPLRQGQGGDLLEAVQREGARPRVGTARPQGAGSLDAGESRVVQGEDVRLAEPSLEGRGDLQAGEGQLRRPALREVPAGSAGDGQVGWLRDGAPAGDGPLDRPSADAHRVRQSRGPGPAEQRQGEPGAVSDERGSQAGRGRPVCAGCGKPRVPAGIGTALKPAVEPIVLARKPLAGTVAGNVLEYGTGGLNIDATRVPGVPPSVPQPAFGVKAEGAGSLNYRAGQGRNGEMSQATQGRWPSNVLLSHAPECGSDDDPGPCPPGCAVAELDAQSGISSTSKPSANVLYGQHAQNGDNEVFGKGLHSSTPNVAPYGDQGGASRFFPTFRYQAKAPTRERPKVGGVAHPTVKPLALMRWLVRLLTPPGGLVLDPFAGSGTTVEACIDEGMRVIGIEQAAEYQPHIQVRIDRALARLVAS